MGGFFGGLFRGILINILGIILVYVIAFCVMAPKLPKDIKSIKTFVSDMVNVKTNIATLNNTTPDYLDNSDLKVDFAEDVLTPAEMAKGISETKVSAEEFFLLKRELARLQKQLDRVENQNRVLSLKIFQQEKNKK